MSAMATAPSLLSSTGIATMVLFVCALALVFVAAYGNLWEAPLVRRLYWRFSGAEEFDLVRRRIQVEADFLYKTGADEVAVELTSIGKLFALLEQYEEMRYRPSDIHRLSWSSPGALGAQRAVAKAWIDALEDEIRRRSFELGRLGARHENELSRDITLARLTELYTACALSRSERADRLLFFAKPAADAPMPRYAQRTQP